MSRPAPVSTPRRSGSASSAIPTLRSSSPGSTESGVLSAARRLRTEPSSTSATEGGSSIPAASASPATAIRGQPGSPWTPRRRRSSSSASPTTSRERPSRSRPQISRNPWPTASSSAIDAQMQAILIPNPFSRLAA